MKNSVTMKTVSTGLNTERQRIAHKIDYETSASKKTRASRIIASKLMTVFKDHIGKRNGISRSDLFKEIYGSKYRDDNLADYMRWEFAKNAMHMLRKKSNCFIASAYEPGGHKYFVVKDDNDAQVYANGISRKMKEMRKMQQKAFRAAKGKWYEQDWQIEGRSTKAL